MGLAELSLTLERRAYFWLRGIADRRSCLPQHLLLGERGEDAAFFHLRSRGYTIVARRWRTERLAGDLDLVAWDGSILVIVEVKTRRSRGLAPAEMAVDSHKQKMLRQMASAYLRQLPASHRASVPIRFDVLSVYLLDTGTEFEHLHDAFPREEPYSRARPPFRS
jgi:putative endonuclease